MISTWQRQRGAGDEGDRERHAGQGVPPPEGVIGGVDGTQPQRYRDTGDEITRYVSSARSHA